MKKLIVWILIITMFTAIPALCTPTQTPQKIVLSGSKSYVGIINNSLIMHMKLTFLNGKVNGTYYYDRYKIPIKLTGKIDSKNNLELKETDSKGKITGYFKGQADSSTKLSGNWVSPDGKKKLPFEAAEEIKANNIKSILGDWTRVDADGEAFFYDSAHANISFLSQDQLRFSIDAFSGGYNGQVENVVGKLRDGIVTYQDGEGFTLRMVILGDTLFVLSTWEAMYVGMSVTLGGRYKKGYFCREPYTLYEQAVFPTEAMDKEFEKLTGEGYDDFASSFQRVNRDTGKEGDTEVAICTGWVRGLSECAIVMYDGKGHFWAAVVNESLDYYTNAPDKTKIPKIIADWAENYGGIEIRYMSK